jgi:uncharacterized membrane protein
MDKARMASFSDGVVAILITIMVLGLTPPHEATLESLRPLVPTFVSYVLSFLFLGIYWNNHHHLLSVIDRVDGRTLWANLHLLFWLSLIPFATSWLGRTSFAAWPVAIYGIDLLLAAVAYFILVRVLIAGHGNDSVLATAVGGDFKGKASVVVYAVAIPLAFANSWLAYGVYAAVALWWLIPDRRLEKTVSR